MELALAGHTITFIGDSVLHGVSEETLKTFLRCSYDAPSPPTWHLPSVGKGEACGWTYSPKHRDSRTYELGAALGNITWRTRWTSLLRWFWDDSPNGQYDQAKLAWREVVDGDSDFVVLAVSAWYLASYSIVGPEGFYADVNRTIAALEDTEAGRRRHEKRCVFWLSLTQPEKMGNDGEFFTMLTGLCVTG